MSDVAAAPSTPAPSAPQTSTSSAPNTAAPGASSTQSTTAQATTSSQSNSKLADTTKPPAQETKTEAERRKYKLKVDGAEQEIELNDTEISVRLQKSVAAEKRMAQAAETQKAFKAFQEAFKADPYEAAKHFAPDLDLDALAEKRIIERFQQEELQKQDPAAYERAQLQKQLDEYKTKEQKVAEEVKFKAQQEHDAKVGSEMERDFIKALELSGLPKDRQYLRMMAEVADTALDNDIELTPDQMAAEVNERIRTQHQHVTRGMKGEALVKHLGNDVVREILKYSVEKHRASKSVVTSPTAPGEESQATKAARKYQSSEEIRGFFRNLKTGK